MRGPTTNVEGDPGPVFGHSGDSGLCRLWVGAIVRLRSRGFQHEEMRYLLRFQERRSRPQQVPVWHELEQAVRAYLEAAGVKGEDGGPTLLRPTTRRMKQLAGNVLGTERFCELVEQRLQDAGLPVRLS